MRIRMDRILLALPDPDPVALNCQKFPLFYIDSDLQKRTALCSYTRR